MCPNLCRGLHNTDVPTLILFSSFKGPVFTGLYWVKLQ